MRGAYPTVDGEFETEWEAEAEWESYPAVQGEFEAEDEYEDESESEAEYEFEFEAEAEYEGESEDESEGFVNPIRRIYPDAQLMAHLSHAAREAESESEAEAFISALVPLAARLIPRAASLVRANAPALIRGFAGITRQLRRNPSTRRYIDTVPVIVQRTAQSLADQVANGSDLDGALVLDTIGRMANRVLATPESRASAVRAVRVFDRGAHASARATRSGAPTARPAARQAAVAARRRSSQQALRRSSRPVGSRGRRF
jgi:hypothetical protein